MKKKLLSIFICLALVAAVLSGCSSKVDNTDETGTDTETTKAPKDDTSGNEEAETISFMCWYDEDDMANVINALNEELGGKYVVEYTYVALSDYNNVLSTQLSAGEGPDVIADGSNFPARIKAGNVVEITGSDYLADLNEAGFALCSDGDKIYGIPSYGWFSGVWYNQDVLDQSGVTELPNTYDEFVAMCEKIAAAGYLPLGFGLADGDTALHSLVGYLENSFYHNNGENTLGIDFDTEFAKGNKTLNGNINNAVAKWATLVEKGYITSEMLGISNEEALNNFIAGKSAMFYGGPWQYTSFADAGMNFGMMPHLSESGENKYMVGGPAVNFGVNVNSKKMDGAQAVLKALSSISVQQAFVDANVGGFSYRAGVVADMPKEYDNVAEIINSGNIACTWDRWSVNMPSQSLIDEAKAQLQGIVSGDYTVEEFVGSLDMRADTIRYE